MAGYLYDGGDVEEIPSILEAIAVDYRDELKKQLKETDRPKNSPVIEKILENWKCIKSIIPSSSAYIHGGKLLSIDMFVTGFSQEKKEYSFRAPGFTFISTKKHIDDITFFVD